MSIQTESDSMAGLESVERTSDAEYAVDTEAQEASIRRTISELIHEVYVEQHFVATGVVDWTDASSLPETTTVEWRKCLELFFTQLDMLAARTNLSKKDIYHTILAGAQAIIRQMPRDLTLWQFFLQDYRHRFNDITALHVTEEDQERSNASTIEDPDALFFPDNATENPSICETGVDLVQPKTPSKNKLGRYAQACAEEYKDLQSPEKRDKYIDLVRRFREEKARQAKPATSRKRMKRVCKRIGENFKVMEENGFAATFWATHADASLIKQRPFHYNVQTEHGSSFHDLMESKNESFPQWAEQAAAASCLERMILNGHGRKFGLIQETQQRDVLPNVDSQVQTETDTSHSSCVAQTVCRTARDRARMEVVQRLLTMLKTAVAEAELAEFQQIIQVTGDHITHRLPQDELKKWPNVATFDEELYRRWKIGLFLHVTENLGFERRHVIGAASYMKQKGGALLSKRLLSALKKGSIMISARNPFRPENDVQGPSILMGRLDSMPTL